MIKKLDAGSTEDIDELKEEWMEEKGYEDEVADNCFFCAYAEQQIQWTGHIGDSNFDDRCPHCPGRQTSPRFNCLAKSYHYSDRPGKFYAKLLKVNEKRKR